MPVLAHSSVGLKSGHSIARFCAGGTYEAEIKLSSIVLIRVLLKAH